MGLVRIPKNVSNGSARSMRLGRRFCSISKPIFFDMKHSNNAARIRLWLALTKCNEVEHRFVKYQDLQTAAFAEVNPLKKVPALIRSDKATVFESNVILNYIEDKYGPTDLKPTTAEDRQVMDLMCRIHDLYIASPNCTAPGFSHSQGSMYLSYGWHGPVRGMDPKTRAAKVAEIWKQLSWLEASAGSPFLVPNYDKPTFADITWFPTCVFMEYMLPRVFDWPDIFDASIENAPFPKIAKWYTSLKSIPEFASTHKDIWDYWVELDIAGQFEPIRKEVKENESSLKFKYGEPPAVVNLNYQTPPPPGKFTGRYIDQEDKGDAVDVHAAQPIKMRNAREVQPPPALNDVGFTLASAPTAISDFRDDAAVVETYYAEMMELIKLTSGADRVFVFDHTIRESGKKNLNSATAGESAAPVPRVHCDYTHDGAPRRLRQLGADGIFSRIRGRELTEEEVEKLMEGRFAFINVWRSICDDHPVLQKPLAVCDERSVPKEDKFLYELRFPNRTGENYSLRHNDEHKWYYYPRMEKDECLVFKVYDKKKDGPRFVFHTAFEDPLTPENAPPRKSIEIRAVAFFNIQDDWSDMKAPQ